MSWRRTMGIRIGHIVSVCDYGVSFLSRSVSRMSCRKSRVCEMKFARSILPYVIGTLSITIAHIFVHPSLDFLTIRSPSSLGSFDPSEQVALHRVVIWFTLSKLSFHTVPR